MDFTQSEGAKPDGSLIEDGMQADILIADPQTAAEILHPHIAAA